MLWIAESDGKGSTRDGSPSRFRPALFLPIVLILVGSAAAVAQTEANTTAVKPGAGTTPSISPQTGQAGVIFLELPQTVRWRPGRAIPLVVSTKAAPANKLVVSAGPFTRTPVGDPLQLDFCLSQSRNEADNDERGCAKKSIDLAANTSKPLWLVGTGVGDTGNFTGLVRIQGEAGVEVNKQLTIAITSDSWRIWGLVALIAGVLLSFLVAVFMPHQRRRDLALRPFALLAERLRKARADLPAGTIANEIKALLDKLTTASLQAAGLVPSRWPSSSAAADPGEELKKQYDNHQARVTALEMLSAAVGRTNDPAKRSNLNALAGAATFPQTDLAVQIDKILLSPASANARRASAAIPTPAQLVTREESRNLLFWVVSSIVSVLAGYALLVEANAAFGNWIDVVGVFLWGLGLSTAGTKVADLQQGQIRTALRTA